MVSYKKCKKHRETGEKDTLFCIFCKKLTLCWNTQKQERMTPVCQVLFCIKNEKERLQT